LITFGNIARERIARTISSGIDKAELRASLQSLEADNHFTDIGNALETLSAILEERKTPGVRQVILFITDGRNTPPRESPYYKKDLSVDDKFRTIGEQISKGGLFLYVIGIGGETDAKMVADAVPGSVYAQADEKLSNVTVQSLADKADSEAQAQEDARRSRQAEEEKAAGLAAQEADGRTNTQEKESEPVFSSFFKNLAGLTGISPDALVFIFPGILLLVILLFVVILLRALRAVDIVISDNIDGMPNRVERSLGPMKGILLNSVDGSLPGIGGQDKGVFRVERGVFGLKVRIIDEDAIASNSPYRKAGVHKLQGTIIELVNGNKIRVAVNKR
jgi:hypothetical protein